MTSRAGRAAAPVGRTGWVTMPSRWTARSVSWSCGICEPATGLITAGDVSAGVAVAQPARIAAAPMTSPAIKGPDRCFGDIGDSLRSFGVGGPSDPDAIAVSGRLGYRAAATLAYRGAVRARQQQRGQQESLDEEQGHQPAEHRHGQRVQELQARA